MQMQHAEEISFALGSCPKQGRHAIALTLCQKVALDNFLNMEALRVDSFFSEGAAEGLSGCDVCITASRLLP